MTNTSQNEAQGVLSKDLETIQVEANDQQNTSPLDIPSEEVSSNFEKRETFQEQQDGLQERDVSQEQAQTDAERQDQDQDQATVAMPLATERSCGACTECCRVLAVAEINKKPFTLCEHTRHYGKTGRCKIHESKPDVCRAFRCFWLKGSFAESERPDKTGIVVSESKTLNGNVLSILVTQSNATGKSTEKGKFYRSLMRWVNEKKRKTFLVAFDGQVTVLNKPPEDTQTPPFVQALRQRGLLRDKEITTAEEIEALKEKDAALQSNQDLTQVSLEREGEAENSIE